MAVWTDEAETQVLTSQNATRWRDIVEPVAALVNQSYTATVSSYFDPDHANYVPAGWSSAPRPQRKRASLRNERERERERDERDERERYRSLLEKRDPALGGMRALLFAKGSRGVLVFRGTDLDATQPSGRADAHRAASFRCFLRDSKKKACVQRERERECAYEKCARLTTPQESD